MVLTLGILGLYQGYFWIILHSEATTSERAHLQKPRDGNFTRKRIHFFKPCQLKCYENNMMHWKFLVIQFRFNSKKVRRQYLRPEADQCNLKKKKPYWMITHNIILSLVMAYWGVGVFGGFLATAKRFFHRKHTHFHSSHQNLLWSKIGFKKSSAPASRCAIPIGVTYKRE